MKHLEVNGRNGLLIVTEGEQDTLIVSEFFESEDERYFVDGMPSVERHYTVERALPVETFHGYDLWYVFSMHPTAREFES